MLNRRSIFEQPDWDQIFPNKNPFNLEIGVGNGEFLTALAKINPEGNFVGIEVKEKYLEKAKRRIERAKTKNAFVLKCDALVHLDALLPSGLVQSIFINFPDPWWKRAHLKRRLFSLATITQMHSLLKESGKIYVVTDVESYYKDIRKVFLGNGSFKTSYANGTDAREKLGLNWYPINYREKEYRAKGKDIFYLIAEANGKCL